MSQDFQMIPPPPSTSSALFLGVGVDGRLQWALLGSSSGTAPSTAAYLLTAANAGLPNGVIVSAYPFVNNDIAAAAAIAVSKLAAGGSSGQILQTITGVPTWSTPTFPIGSPAIGNFMIGDGTNWIVAPYDFPAAVGSAGNYLRSDGTDFASSAIQAGDLPSSVIQSTPPGGKTAITNIYWDPDLGEVVYVHA
jgi:hypothetical protein